MNIIVFPMRHPLINKFTCFFVKNGKNVLNTNCNNVFTYTNQHLFIRNRKKACSFIIENTVYRKLRDASGDINHIQKPSTIAHTNYFHITSNITIGASSPTNNTDASICFSPQFNFCFNISFWCPTHKLICNGSILSTNT